MKIILYSTHCVNCVVLEKKLKQKNIEFDIVDDVDLMKQKGFMSAPMLEVDGVVMNYKTAIQWVNNQ